MNIAERCGYWARSRADDVAISGQGRAITWRELSERVERIAGGLAGRGIGAGDRVGVLASNSIAWCEFALAVLHRGAVIVPLNVRLAAPELGSIIAHAECAAVAYDHGLAGLYAAATQDIEPMIRIALDDEAAADVALPDLLSHDRLPLVHRADDDVAIIGYTSGTTGLPKGAMLTHANLAAHVLQTALALGSTHDRRTLLSLPLAFTGGLVNVLISSFGVGGTLVVGGATFDATQTLTLLQREHITAWWAVPVMWQAVADADGFDDADLSALRTGICGGAPVSDDLLRTFLAKGVAVCHSYGLTEATASVSVLPPHLTNRIETVGRANVHTEIRLVDSSGAPVPHGEVGEVTVRGPQVMSGYWRDPEATAEAIRGCWLHTGDLARWTEDDLLLIVDRTKNMFISGGLNVYPAEIERVVARLPGITECVAYGRPDDRWGERCALIVHGPDDLPDPDDIINYCREHLADYKVPHTVRFAEQPLPRSMSGKILRKEAQHLYG